jgi:5-oxoprolinase (ATP-hydrolysing)
VAEGFIQIAVQQMANAIKKISVARGYDVTRYTLQCFGGAGGQHACLVADALGMTRVLVHPLAGVLSAYGMGLADQNVIREQAVELKLALDALPEIAAKLDALAAAAGGELARQQASAGAITTHRRVHVRYEGSDSALVVPFPDPAPDDGAALVAAVAAGFEAAYRQRFAFLMQGKRLVAEAVSVEAVVPGDAPEEPRHEMHPAREVPRRETVRMYSGGQWHDAALVVREDMRCGDVTGRVGPSFAEAERDDRGRAGLGRRSITELRSPRARARDHAAQRGAPCRGHDGRSGIVRGVQ